MAFTHGFILRNPSNVSQTSKYKSPSNWCSSFRLMISWFACRVATGLVLGGNLKFHSRARTVVDIIMETANKASVTIYNTTGAMRNIRQNLETTGVSVQASYLLNSTSDKLDTEAADIERQARKNRRLIEKGLKMVYIVTTVIISLNLIAMFSLSGFCIASNQSCIYRFWVHYQH